MTVGADMALVRTTDGHNLAVGEPYFLREILGLGDMMATAGVGVSLGYPAFRGSQALLDELAWLYPGKHVVIANGAKQALLAATHAIVGGRQGLRALRHEPPYWPTYPTIAKLTGLEFRAKADFSVVLADEISVMTSPNNPDGRICPSTSLREWDILDMAYGSRVYGWDGVLPYHRISVWSGAKLFGLSGLRVGWLVTGDKALAERAATYVEQSTSGVSNITQAWMAEVLRWWRADLSVGTRFALQRKARNVLIANAVSLELAIDKHLSELKGFPDNMQGMFAWVKAKDPERFTNLLTKADVKVVAGEHCGADPQEGWFRISLGLTQSMMEKAMSAISREDT